MSKEYEVGRGKPPKAHQYPKGTSGNLRGRPKGSRNFSKDVKDTLKEPVRLTKGGKRKTVSTQHATLLRLREKALSGDARALNRMIDLARTYNDEEIAEEAAKLSLNDAELLEAYNERLLRRAGKARPDDNDDAPEKDDDDA